MSTKIKMVEARNVRSAAMAGCTMAGRCPLVAMKVYSVSIGMPSKPTGAWTKCSISIDEVIAKKVEAPRQKGSRMSMAGISMSSACQQELHNL